jgi:hypothetical protein
LRYSHNHPRHTGQNGTTLKKVALVAALVATFALGIDGTIAYSQAAVRASNDECGKPPPKLIKKVAKYSVRKGYVPLTTKILAKVNKTKTKPKPKAEEPCDTIKPIVAEPAKVEPIDPMQELIRDLPVIVPDPAPAVASVTDTLPDHAVIAPIVVSTPTTVVGQAPSYGQWWGGFFAGQIHFVDRTIQSAPPFSYVSRVKPIQKPDVNVPVPAPATAALVVVGLWLAVKRTYAKG